MIIMLTMIFVTMVGFFAPPDDMSLLCMKIYIMYTTCSADVTNDIWVYLSIIVLYYVELSDNY